jgi:hypothetical protein
MCALTSILVGPRTHHDRWQGREDSKGSTIGELKVDLSHKILALGTGLLLVCRATPANSSMLYPNVKVYKGPIGLSPPMAYL